MNIEIKKVTQCVTFSESERRDSDPRPQPWQGCALPTELLSHLVPGVGLEPTRPQWSKDFKSFVSTNSTIRAYQFISKKGSPAEEIL